MNSRFLCQLLVLAGTIAGVAAVAPPQGLVSRTGDQSIVLHWDRNTESNLSGYRVYRGTAAEGPYTPLVTSFLLSPGYCDLTVTNGMTNFYQVTAVLSTSEESAPAGPLAAVAHPFRNDDEFLEYVQQVHFDYFWYLANPRNGLVPDRTARGSA